MYNKILSINAKLIKNIKLIHGCITNTDYSKKYKNIFFISSLLIKKYKCMNKLMLSF